MTGGPERIDLTQDDLRAVGSWALPFVERALAVYEGRVPSDPRPREAVEGLREFVAGGRRTARLRVLAWAAWAAREAGDPAASAAARAASLAAAIPYTHPIAAPSQAHHTLGPVAYAALALELAAGGGPRADSPAADSPKAGQPQAGARKAEMIEAGAPGTGVVEVEKAIARASGRVGDILVRMASPPAGRGRYGEVLRMLDAGIRGESGAGRD